MQRNNFMSTFQRDFLGSNLELDRQALIPKTASDTCYTSKGVKLSVSLESRSEPELVYSTRAATTSALVFCLRGSKEII